VRRLKRPVEHRALYAASNGSHVERYVPDAVVVLLKELAAIDLMLEPFMPETSKKIIDAIVSQTLPIYLGAADISEFIPKNCFIDVCDFLNIDYGL
jgi:methionyl-tRNA synthetase